MPTRTRLAVSQLAGHVETSSRATAAHFPPHFNEGAYILATWSNEQALVCLYKREIVVASRGRPFHCKMANSRFITVVFSICVGLIYLAI